MQINKIKLIGALLVLGAIIAIIFIIHQRTSPTPIANLNTPKAGPLTVKGALICLPKKGSGPHTLECAIGLRSESNQNFALKDLSAVDPGHTYTTDTKVEISGTFAPELNQNPTYDTVGTLSVDSIKKQTPPSTNGNTVLTIPELKYSLEAQLGTALFCGPSALRIDYQETLIKQFPEVVKHTSEFNTIIKHLSFEPKDNWSNEQKISIATEYNRLSSISVEPFENKFKFKIRTISQEKGEFIYEGYISETGILNITKKELYTHGCPQ